MRIYIVLQDEVWDGENWDSIRGAFRNYDDAVACVKARANEIRGEWANESVEENDASFHAWRDGEYCLYHCDLYIDETELI